MSILIKGMGMPKEIEPGLVIEFADGIDGKRYARLYHYRNGGLTEWLEAIPVPEHGRLIDADKLLNDAEYHEVPIFDTDGSWDDNIKCIEVDDIVNAPTIIEAEEEGE